MFWEVHRLKERSWGGSMTKVNIQSQDGVEQGGGFDPGEREWVRLDGCTCGKCGRGRTGESDDSERQYKDLRKQLGAQLYR